MKQYNISFCSERHLTKPDKYEIGTMSGRLHSEILAWNDLSKLMAYCGCTFAPAVFKDNERKKENFLRQQVFALDFDSGITAAEVKNRADSYRLPALFSYKTFSWTPEKDKFRVVFALDHVIYDRFTAESIIGMLMFIFPECDKACKDVSRMFLGSNNGLIKELTLGSEISIDALDMAVYLYAVDRYGEAHYKREVNKLYDRLYIKIEKSSKIYHLDEQGYIVMNKVEIRALDRTDMKNSAAKENGRRQLSNVDFKVLYDRCRMYRNFVSGTEYYYYHEMFFMASNFINMQKESKAFMKAVWSKENEHCVAYTENRDWAVIMRYMKDRGYNPQRCDEACPYAKDCPHCKNMILTAAPGKTNIVPLKMKEYVTIEEADESLVSSIKDAMSRSGIKIIKAQTGLGKTTKYLEYILDSDRKYLIVVPTHKLADEICIKAQNMGITDIIKTPELKGFSDELMEEIQHIYDTGAGILGLTSLRNRFEAMNKSNPDYSALKAFFDRLDAAESHTGNLVITHERFLNLTEDSPMLDGRTVIVDEDILRTMLTVHCVSVKEVGLAIKRGVFDEKTVSRLKKILTSTGFRRYSGSKTMRIDEDVMTRLRDIRGNVLDLASASVLKNDGETITYLRTRQFPCRDVTILSATVDPKLYELYLGDNIKYYQCKEAPYKGRVHVHTDSTYSRDALINSEGHEELIKKLKEQTKSDIVITFVAVEEAFDTNLHYGNVEGLDFIKGKNISVIGLPNINEVVYKLYGMAMGIYNPEERMIYQKIQHNDHEFYLTTYRNETLRRIQLWFLETQLEQAVGRARLLRCDCKVTVYARFPIEQGEYE